MESDKRSLRVGTAVILCAVVLRLLSNSALQPVFRALDNPNLISFLMYLETGRKISAASLTSESPEDSSVPSDTTVPTSGQAQAIPAFTAGDLECLSIRYDGDYRPDLAPLLEAPLDWALADGQPRVLILHTHATESYTPSPGEDYPETSDYRTLDEGYNMLSIGDRVAQILEAAGISVIHDRTLHDYPSYNGSYLDAREAMESYLEQYPSIRLVLDLHRDAAEDGDGQMDTSAQVNGAESAQVMLVVGTDEGGLEHPQWQDNLSLALKLGVQLERLYPGICRPISLRTERFNQDLSAGALLIEVGAAGNTHAEALTAAEALAQAIAALAQGANTQ